MLSSQSLLRCSSLLLSLIYLNLSGVSAQDGDGGAAQGVQPGTLGSDSSGSENAAAEGPDTGSANLSHGAVIAIAVVVSVTVVLGSKYTNTSTVSAFVSSPNHHV